MLQRPLIRRLTDAVQSGDEPQVVADEVTWRTGLPCVVLVRREDGWLVRGMAGVRVEAGPHPPPAELEAWLAANTGWHGWASQNVCHGRRVVGAVFVPSQNAAWDEIAEVCGVAAPFFAALQPRVAPNTRLDATQVAQIVHDLRQPLSVFAISIELLKEGTPEPSPHIERCQRSIAHQRELIDDLLLLAGADKRPRTSVSLAAIAAELLDDLAEQARLGEVTIVRELDGPSQTIGARLSLTRALGNVIENAIAMSPPGSVVRVRSGTDAGRAYVEVHDQGPGVAPELRDKVFEPFFTTRKKGNGLGLAVARLVAQAHGGNVQFLDGPGGIVRFEFVAAERARPK
jgi:signal transduction histidine kinase